MLCKKCGKEIPVSGKFCPYCGFAQDYTGANDETAMFTPVTDPTPASEPTPVREPDESLIDASAWNAAREEDIKISGFIDEANRFDDSALTDTDEAISPETKTSSAAGKPTTTYFDAPETEEKPYKKPKSKKPLVITLVCLLIAALIGGGIWYVSTHKSDENLTLAEKYMEKGKFEQALEAYQAALGEKNNNTTEIQTQISLLNDYLTAKKNLEQGEYAQALALLSSLNDRITDKTSTLYDAVQSLIEETNAQQSNSQFETDIADAASNIADKNFDRAAAILDSLSADTSLTSDQKKQVTKLREELEEAKKTADRQQQGEEDKKQKKQEYNERINTLEKNEKDIASIDDTEKALEATSTSFEAWDSLLSDMYDYLSKTLNAEAYATEEESYKTWVKERDAGAENAAKDIEDETAAALAKASFKQSYTKTRCYKILDLI